MTRRKGLDAALQHSEEDNNSLDIFGRAAPAVAKKTVETVAPTVQAVQPEVARAVETPKVEEVVVQPRVEQRKSIGRSSVTHEDIVKLLSLNDLYLSKGQEVQAYITGFLGAEDIATTIYNALNTDYEHVSALKNVYKLYESLPADRAFLLVSMKDVELSEIKHQLARIVEMPDDIPASCTPDNKIPFCRKIEQVISGLSEDEYEVAKEIAEFLGVVYDNQV